MKDTYLNMWLESQKKEKERTKLLIAYLDSINQINAEIAAHRVATNRTIQEIFYKAMFGDGK